MVKALLKDLPEGFQGMPASNGYSPDLSEWISNQQYVPRNLIAAVVRNLNSTEQDNILGKVIRVILELHPISIKGFWTGFCAEHSYAPSPTFRVAEKYGRPVDNALTEWRLRYDCYRNTLAPENWQPEGNRQPTKEEATIDVMFFEVDPTHTVIQQAWLGLDMYPMDYEGLESTRDITRRVPPWNFHGFRTRPPKSQICKFELGYESFKTGAAVNAQAQDLLNGINVTSANPYSRDQFVTAIAQEVSLNKE